MTVSPDQSVAFAAEIRRLPDDLVFLSGSRAEGWHNNGSDYDWYVITSAPAVGEAAGRLWTSGQSSKEVEISYELNGTSHVEVQYWPRDLVEELRTFTNSSRLQGFSELPPRYVDFIHRLKIGIPIGNPAEFERLHASFLWDEYAYYRAISSERLFEAYLHDSGHFLEEGRLGEALITGRLALEASVDCYLSLKGETNPGSKWRLRKLKRTSGSTALHSAYMDVLTGWDTSAAKAVRRMRIFADSVNLCCQLHRDFDELFGYAAAELAERNPSRDVAIRLKTDLRGQARLISHDGRGREITSGAALLWALCDGSRDEAALVSSLAKVAVISERAAHRDVTLGLELLWSCGLLDQRADSNDRVRDVRTSG